MRSDPPSGSLRTDWAKSSGTKQNRPIAAKDDFLTKLLILMSSQIAKSETYADRTVLVYRT